jgi:hypothetical protein
MPGEGLPPGFDLLFSNDDASGRVLDMDLPPGRLVVPKRGEPGTAPAYWLSDEPVSPDLWVRLRQAHPRSGLWPVLARGFERQPERPWAAGEVWPPPRPVDRIGRLDAAAVLEGFWTAHMSGEHLFLEPVGDDPREMTGEIHMGPRDGLEQLEPFGPSWPGLAPAGDRGLDPDEFADQYVREYFDEATQILLVAATRSADVAVAAGWMGPCNYTNDMPLLSSVLRSWEDRFGARVIQIGFDTLLLSVAAPPCTTGHAEHVAAEHFAFCSDIVLGDRYGTLRQYTAHMVQGQSEWWFWWD